MKKKAAKTTATETPKSEGGRLQIVKGIKNTMFKDVPIGGACIVAGVVRGVSSETGTYGDYYKFKGDFAAKVGEKTFKSGTLYLPEVAADIIANAFLSAKDAAPEPAEGQKVEMVSVEFKIRLRKNPDEKSNTGFVWVAEPVKEIAPESDKVLLLLEG